VANSIGSFSAAFTVYETLKMPGANSPVYTWILALGATGIVVGLATYGEARPAFCGVGRPGGVSIPPAQSRPTLWAAGRVHTSPLLAVMI
jgi:hypothetical protein